MAFSERDVQTGSPAEGFTNVKRMKKILSSNFFSLVNPFLINNLTPRLDLPFFSLGIKYPHERGNESKSVGFSWSSEAQEKNKTA